MEVHSAKQAVQTSNVIVLLENKDQISTSSLEIFLCTCLHLSIAY